MSQRKVRFGNYHVKLPASRVARLGLGFVLIVVGLFGFLPVIGFWMIPLGLLIISYDIAMARRARRKAILWWNGRNGKGRNGRNGTGAKKGKGPASRGGGAPQSGT